MIFSSKPALIAMERMMTQPPYYRPPGHGKYQPKKLPPDKAHYKCEYCLHYDRKKNASSFNVRIWMSASKPELSL